MTKPASQYCATLALGVALAIFSTPAHAINRSITVNGGSLTNPIGVGFGVWEGAEPLKVTLDANPGDISQAEMFAPEDVIWYPSDSTAPDPWVFETRAVIPDEAFAVKFKGLIGGGTGTTPPPEWAVAVSDLDFDGDSTNASTVVHRPPNESADEDKVEIPTAAGGVIPTGMVMHLGEDWAFLQLKSHLKRSGRLQIRARRSDLLDFQLADENVNVLVPIGREGPYDILFERQVGPGDGPWSFYVKPTAQARTGRQALIRAIFFPLGPTGLLTGSDQASEDQVQVQTTNGWQLGGDTPRHVMVEADENYSDQATHPARMKRFVVRPPLTLPMGTRFKLRLRHPANDASKLVVMHQSQPLTFTNDISDSSFPAVVTEFHIKGLPVQAVAGLDPWMNAGQSASRAFEDQGIDVVRLNAQGQPMPNPVAVSNWTSLWVTVSIQASPAQSVAQDNSARFRYLFDTGAFSLGPTGSGADGNQFGVRLGVQLTGRLAPMDYPSAQFRWRRIVVSNASYLADDLNRNIHCFSGFNGQSDDSLPNYADEDPTSEGSTGTIYDVDVPGLPGASLTGLADKAVFAFRDNFREWATFSGERCSERFPWFVRRAAQKQGAGAAGAWTSINLSVDPTQPDNQGGRGTTSLGYRMDNPALSATLTELNRQAGPPTRITFLTSATGGDAPFLYTWQFRDFTGTVLEQRTTGPIQSRSDLQTRAFPVDNVNQGNFTITVTVNDSMAREACAEYRFDLSRPPRPIIVSATAVGATLVFRGTHEPGDLPLASHEWRIIFADARGATLGTLQGMLGLDVDVRRPIPAGTRTVLLQLRCVDARGEFLNDDATLTLP